MRGGYLDALDKDPHVDIQNSDLTHYRVLGMRVRIEEDSSINIAGCYLRKENIPSLILILDHLKQVLDGV